MSMFVFLKNPINGEIDRLIEPANQGYAREFWEKCVIAGLNGGWKATEAVLEANKSLEAWRFIFNNPENPRKD